MAATQQKEVLDAWGDWLATLAPWNWFATFTFRSLDDGSGDRGFGRIAWYESAWANFVRELDGPLQHVQWVRAYERHKWRDDLHIHALIAGVGDVERRTAWRWWFDRYGVNRILPYAPERGGARYIAKYVVKELGDVRFSANLG
jgi:hypothetical protein